MDNSFFVFSDDYQIEFERFHLCIWEFHNSSLVEFGGEIKKECVNGKGKLTIYIYIPWLKKGCSVTDFYIKLKDSENSRFIFNDSIINTTSMDGGNNKRGVIHEFSGRNKLCILPVNLNSDFEKNILPVQIDLSDYNQSGKEANIYFRFSVKPNEQHISTRKNGISKSTIIYDIKINERRNLPENLAESFRTKKLNLISSCFCFFIVPNSFDLTFFESEHLKNVRSLEYDSFNHYLKDNRIKKDELIVVFNKKNKSDSYSFFSMFTKERIGAGQFALALLINLICSILLFFPAYRKSFLQEMTWKESLLNMPVEFYVATVIIGITIFYFIWPSVTSFPVRIWSRIKSISFKKNNKI